MNALEIIAYILIALGIYRLLMTQGMCPGGWGTLVIGVLILWNRGKLTLT